MEAVGGRGGGMTVLRMVKTLVLAAMMVVGASCELSDDMSVGGVA